MTLLLLLACSPLVPTPETAGEPLDEARSGSPASSSSATPDADWLTTVRARAEAGRRAFRPVEGGWVATHAATGLVVSVGSEGVGIANSDGEGGLRLHLAEARVDGLAEPLAAAAPGLDPCPDPEDLDLSGACLPGVTLHHGAVTEWWRSTAAGVEQGFTVEGAGDSLELELALDGAEASVLDGRAALLETDDGHRLRYRGLRAWDAAGRDLPAVLRADGDRVVLAVDTRGATWPVTVDPLFDAAAWETGSSTWNSWYGTTIVPAGDVNNDGFGDVLVGEPEGVSGSISPGLVHLFLGSASGLSTTAAWTGAGTTNVGYYGSALAALGDLDGDGFDDVAVGAPYEQVGTTLGWAGHVYVLRGGTSGFTTALTLSASQSSEYFGLALAAADVNGDGRKDLVVGAPGYDDGQAEEGRFLVFHGSSSGISSTAALTVESDQAGARMGVALAGLGLVNADSFEDLAVGVPLWDGTATDEGRVLVYHGASGGLSSTPASTLSQGHAGGQLGWSVAAAGDVNGDGRADLSVGEPGYTGSFSGEGRALVFLGGSTGLASSAAWTWEGGATNRALGAARSLGDLDGDGYDDLGLVNGTVAQVHLGGGTGPSAGIDCSTSEEAVWFVGGVGDVDNDGDDEVAVGWGDFLFTDEVPTYTGHATLYAGQDLCGSLRLTGSTSFGVALSGAGDVNGDGFDDLLVGDDGFDDGQTDEGAAMLFLGSAAGLSTTASWTVTSNQADAGMGAAVAGAGDLNCDGFADLVVGAPDYDSRVGADVGRVFVYLGAAGGPSTTPATTITGSQASARFGFSLAGASVVRTTGCRCFVAGAPFASNGQSAEGQATVYCGNSSTGLSLTTFATLEVNQAGANFGWSVAGPGNVNGSGTKGSDVAVGAPAYDNGQLDEGAVFVWHGGASLSASPQTTLDGNQANGAFGKALSRAGDVNGDGFADLVVGMPEYDTSTLSSAGRTLVYRGSSSGLVSTPLLDLPGDRANSECGNAVGGGGDWDGDGFDDVIAGCRQYDLPSTNQGTVYLWRGAASPSTTPALTLRSDGVAASFMGSAVTFAGDVDGDGGDELAAQIPFWNFFTNQGVVVLR